MKMRKVRRRGRKGRTHHKLQAVAHASPQNCLFWGLVLEPHFAQSCGPLRATLLPSWLADFAATPQGCCACVGQVVVCRASSLHLQCLSEKWKMPIEDKHFLLAPNSTVYLVSVVAFMAQLVWRHSCVADRLPVTKLELFQPFPHCK